MWVHSQVVYVFAFYLLQHINAITTITTAKISKAGFIRIKAIIKNNATNNKNFPIASMPEKSLWQAALIEPIMNNIINATKCIIINLILSNVQAHTVVTIQA